MTRKCKADNRSVAKRYGQHWQETVLDQWSELHFEIKKDEHEVLLFLQLSQMFSRSSEAGIWGVLFADEKTNKQKTDYKKGMK